MDFKHLKWKNQDFYISTADTFDRGLETMVFGIVDGKIDWHELSSKLHDTQKEAIEFHKLMVEEHKED